MGRDKHSSSHLEQKNEERILTAALEVVQEYTISGTRMHLIAENAQMVQSNLHYYYKTKKDLMIALQKKVLIKCQELRKVYRRNSSDTLDSQLDVFIEQKRAFIMEYREYDYAEMDFWVQGRIEPEMKKGFAESFCGWRKEIKGILHQYVPDLTKKEQEQLALITVSMLEGATIQYLVDEDSFELEEYFGFVKSIILDTVGHCVGDRKRQRSQDKTEFLPKKEDK